MSDSRVRHPITKRKVILDSATELLLASGYEGVSMDAVAARAGVSKTTVYAHFPEKLELFRAVMAEAAGAARSAFDDAIAGVAGASAEDRLVAVIAEMARASSAPEVVAYFRILIADTDRRDEIRKVFDEVQLTVPMPDIPKIVGQMLNDVVRTEDAELENPTQSANALLRMTVSGLQFDLLVSDFRPGRGLLEAHLSYVIRAFVRGIVATAGRERLVLPIEYDYPWAMFQD